MFQFMFVQNPSFSLDRERIKEIFQRVDEEGEKIQKWTINIAFLDTDTMRSLNRKHRAKDKTTDVLSFHYFEDFSYCDEQDTVWEIVMDASLIRSQAREHGHSVREECEILILHALLHILGYDHERDEDFEKMWKIESIIRTHMSLSLT